MSCLGDMLTRIRNAALRRKPFVVSPFSGLHAKVLDVLQEEGYIRGYSLVDCKKGKYQLKIELKYSQGSSVIREISCVSRSGRRCYSRAKEIPRFFNGLGVMVVTTSKGVMADHKAREYNVGGEVLCSVF
ncbi:30S ribosomal protein S8 [Candidatus Liberibacter sp.]|uniref:30S ribosomal protein S8 n=1 Tax=Candidatus Liberibacter sp. TaxID=34022 RepID=UPI0015F667F4|nr:30S ribosomal protein S8 [Candidatus Liberibacter sp.]MBA5724636.1 30S ribosomal protein S8 [Candidatus Liberibacter sp.]